MRGALILVATFLLILVAGLEAWSIAHGGGQPLAWVAAIGSAVGAVCLCVGYVRDHREDTPRR